MICQFSFKGEPIYIRAASIVALMADETNKKQTVVFTEPPLDSVVVDEAVEEAYLEWFYTLNEEVDAEIEDNTTWAEAALET